MREQNLQQPFNVPILFLIFNRQKETHRVFQEIKKIKPSSLFIAADGPRRDFNSDYHLCEATKNVIQIDWECEVHKLYRTENLGCRVAVSSAIDWFFSHVKKGIIIEDDCLPSLSFFSFCENMLNKYEDSFDIMSISGANHQSGIVRGNDSYFFSKIPHIWGWATWRRAWDLYDVNMKEFPEFHNSNKIKNVFKYLPAQKEQTRILKKIYNGADTWDYQWAFTLYKNTGFSISPNKNLVKNIGFGNNSTHFFEKSSKFREMIQQETDDPIRHPLIIERNEEADDYEARTIFAPKPLSIIILKFFSHIKRKLLK